MSGFSVVVHVVPTVCVVEIGLFRAITQTGVFHYPPR